MKKVTFIVFTISCLFFYSNVCHATLTTLTSGEDQVVYDDVNNQYWFMDLSVFSGQTFSSKLSGISNLNNDGGYYGLTNWSMASLSEITPLWDYSYSEITAAFLPSNDSNPDWEWWAGSYNEVSPNVLVFDPITETWDEHPGHYNAVIFEPDYKGALSSIYQGDFGPNNYQGAWVVATVAPEPISSTLFIVGGATLGFRRFRKKFKK